MQQDLLAAPRMIDLLRQAHQRGVQLLWRGAAGERPDSAIAPCFARTIIGLTPGETLVGAHVALQQGRDNDAAAAASNPVLPGQIVEAVPSRLMADHCLDRSGAWGVAGWPTDDVLLSHQHQPIQPSHRAIVRLVRETDDDVALDLLEHTLADEPLLAYRFLRYTNSAALGLRKERRIAAPRPDAAGPVALQGLAAGADAAGRQRTRHGTGAYRPSSCAPA